MVIFGIGFQISDFCFEKNSTRKMTIFHPEKSQAWKMAIFSGEISLKQKWEDMKFQSSLGIQAL